MRRTSEDYLARWLGSRRRRPLILRGARQVGKSTLVRNFAQAQELQLNEINLERHPELNTVFATLDTGLISAELEAMLGRSIRQPGSMLFLDEIQATPAAIQALRYLYEDLPELPVIAAGSLLEFTLSDHSFSMPVGRIEYHHLGPMTFGEFLEALEPHLLTYLDQLSFDSEIPEAAHQSLLHRQRQYLLSGGMPEAVLVLQETGSLVEAAAVHRRIISTYQDDFAKYAHRDRLALLQRVFLAIPRQVGQKVKYVSYSRESPAKDVREALDLLTKARVCHRVPSSHCSGVPLHADINENVSKLLFLDVGLMNHVCGLDWTALREMSDLTLVNEGAIAEQLIGQHLVHASGGLEPPTAVYWLREGRSSNAEVDFVISHGTEVVPVEVKAGRSGSLRSLHQFILAGKATRAVRFDTNKPSRQIVQVQAPSGSGWRDVSYELLSLPLYAVGELSRLLSGEEGRGASR